MVPCLVAGTVDALEAARAARPAPGFHRVPGGIAHYYVGVVGRAADVDAVVLGWGGGLGEVETEWVVDVDAASPGVGAAAGVFVVVMVVVVVALAGKGGAGWWSVRIGGGGSDVIGKVAR